jgi:hypothetical protein
VPAPPTAGDLDDSSTQVESPRAGYVLGRLDLHARVAQDIPAEVHS